jgi:8-oxo-dGTP diphosphatase
MKYKFKYEYPRPSATADSIILRTPTLGYPEVLLISRNSEPFQDHWALPGGFIEMDEEPLISASRELFEETGLADLPIKPIFASGSLNRDPRGRTITFVFGCLVRDTVQTPVASSDAQKVAWFSLKNLPKLAFDHKNLLLQAVQSLHWQARYCIIGQDVFHSLSSIKDMERLHQSILNASEAADTLERAIKMSLIKCKDGICEYLRPVPHGPDWHPMPW